MLAVSLPCRAFYCAMFPLFPLWWEFLSWIDVEFYLMIFLHLFRWSCGFCGVSCVSCDHVFLWCFVWCITLIDLHVLDHPCDPGMNPTWHWCMMFFLCVVGFGLLIFSWEFLHIYIHQRVWQCLCLVLLSGWWRLRMSLEVFLPLQSFGRAWEGSV